MANTESAALDRVAMSRDGCLGSCNSRLQALTVEPAGLAGVEKAGFAATDRIRGGFDGGTTDGRVM